MNVHHNRTSLWFSNLTFEPKAPTSDKPWDEKIKSESQINNSTQSNTHFGFNNVLLSSNGHSNSCLNATVRVNRVNMNYVTSLEIILEFWYHLVYFLSSQITLWCGVQEQKYELQLWHFVNIDLAAVAVQGVVENDIIQNMLSWIQLQLICCLFM